MAMGGEDLLEWASSLGIKDTPPSNSSSSSSYSKALGFSLTLSNFPDAGGRGLAAARNLKEGELILRVPKSALISVETARCDIDIARSLGSCENLSSVQVLIIHLLKEISKNKASKWQPYLFHLPRFHHTLAHFSDFEAKALQFRDAVQVAEAARLRAYKEWEEAGTTLRRLKLQRSLTTFSAWLWASATVSSRTLHVPWDDAGALCPVGDLFNYTPPGLPQEQRNQEESKREETETPDPFLSTHEDSTYVKERLTDGGYEASYDAYCFYAHSNYKKGDQVFLSYGVYNNLELLEHYGFLLSDNPYDELCIALVDCEGLTGAMCLSSPSGLHIQVDGKPSFSSLSTLRLCSVPSSIRKTKGYLAISGLPISLESDVIAYKRLLVLCEKIVADLPTPYDNDATLKCIIDKLMLAEDLQEILECWSEGSESRSDKNPMLQPLGEKDRKNIVNEIQQFASSLMNCNDHLGKRGKQWKSGLERWALAVQWRLGQKTILDRCILHCRQRLAELIQQ